MINKKLKENAFKTEEEKEIFHFFRNNEISGNIFISVKIVTLVIQKFSSSESDFFIDKILAYSVLFVFFNEINFPMKREEIRDKITNHVTLHELCNILSENLPICK